MLKKGLNSFEIKVLALILMTFDHIHYMFVGVTGVPVWFTILGRISAPLFIFMVANGMRYTRSREKYLLRLLIGSLGMSLLNKTLGSYLVHPAGAMMFANIFSTLFLICFYIYLGQKVKEGIIQKKYGKVMLSILGMLIPIMVSVFLMMIIGQTQPNLVGMNILMMIPSLMFTEGGFMYVILGIGFYLCGSSKTKQTVFYVIYCIILFVINILGGVTIVQLFTTDIQWFMVFALPIILLYNNEKGTSMKYFFYFYYPIHLYVLLFLSTII